MFIAMNRFKVRPDATAAFEEVWTSRDTYLRDVPGFVEFHLLRGPEREDHVLVRVPHDLGEPSCFRGMDTE